MRKTYALKKNIPDLKRIDNIQKVNGYDQEMPTLQATDYKNLTRV